MKAFTKSPEMEERAMVCMFFLLITTSVTADSNFKVTLSKSPEGNVKEGEKVSVTCNASSNLKDEKYSWYRFDNDWKKHTTGKTLEETFQNDSIKYSCRVEVTGGFKMSSAFSLSAFYSPRDVNIGIYPNWQVMEGYDVNMSCTVNSSNPEATLTWVKNNRSYIEIDTLILRNVTKRFAGKYKCVAANFLGQAESPTAVLDILSATTVTEEFITPFSGSPSQSQPMIPAIIAIICIFILLLVITSVIFWKRHQSKMNNAELASAPITFNKKEDDQSEKHIYTPFGHSDVSGEDFALQEKPEDQSHKHIYSALDPSATKSDDYAELEKREDQSHKHIYSALETSATKSDDYAVLKPDGDVEKQTLA